MSKKDDSKGKERTSTKATSGYCSMSRTESNYEMNISALSADNSVFISEPVQQLMNYLQKILTEIDTNKYEECLTDNKTAQEMITDHFKQLKSKINSNLKNYSSTTDENVDTNLNDLDISEMIENFKDDNQAHEFFENLNTELNNTLKRFEDEANEFIEKTYFIKKIKMEENLSSHLESNQKKNLSVDDSSKPPNLEIESLFLEINQLENELISNLDKIICNEKSVKLSVELKTLVEESNNHMKKCINAIKSASYSEKDANDKIDENTIKIYHETDTDNENKFRLVNVRKPDEDATKLKFDLKFRFENLIKRIKFHLFSNGVYQYSPADEMSSNIGYLFKTSLANFDSYQIVNLYEYFQVETTQHYDMNDDMFYIEQLNEDEYFYFYSNDCLLKSIIVLDSPKDITKKSQDFKLEFECESIRRIDKLENNFILVVTKCYLKTQYLHFIDISDKHKFYEDLKLKREISNTYKYLSSYENILYFFDSESKAIKGYEIKNNNFAFVSTNTLKNLQINELFDIKQFIRYKTKYFMRIITDGNHSDYIYIIDETKTLLEKLYCWGDFKLIDDYLVVLEGDYIRSYNIVNKALLSCETEIIRSNERYDALLTDLKFISKDAKSFKFLNGSNIFI